MITQKIYDWAKVRGILDASADAQLGRLIEEAGEVAKEIRSHNTEAIIDEIGDMAVVVLNHYAIKKKKPYHWDFFEFSTEFSAAITSEANRVISKVISNTADNNHGSAMDFLSALSRALTNKPLSYCLEHAYNKIKDRRGLMVNGSYVKEQDFIKRGITVDWENLTEGEAMRARKEFLGGDL